MQVTVTAVEQWSITNKLQLNPDKCKELLIDFKERNTILMQLLSTLRNLNV